mmetsp:Transcript_86/g.157  ORF Transcript_86/g.157 Transcript_86/m.157 type:complete len:134 (+) Transcript_86:367-768(+)
MAYCVIVPSQMPACSSSLRRLKNIGVLCLSLNLYHSHLKSIELCNGFSSYNLLTASIYRNKLDMICKESSQRAEIIMNILNPDLRNIWVAIALAAIDQRHACGLCVIIEKVKAGTNKQQHDFLVRNNRLCPLA